MTEGYLDGVGGVFTCKGRRKRPKLFTLNCLEGLSNRYAYEIMNIGELSDEDLFGKCRNTDRSERRIVRKVKPYERGV